MVRGACQAVQAAAQALVRNADEQTRASAAVGAGGLGLPGFPPQPGGLGLPGFPTHVPGQGPWLPIPGPAHDDPEGPFPAQPDPDGQVDPGLPLPGPFTGQAQGQPDLHPEKSGGDHGHVLVNGMPLSGSYHYDVGADQGPLGFGAHANGEADTTLQTPFGVFTGETDGDGDLVAGLTGTLHDFDTGLFAGGTGEYQLGSVSPDGHSSTQYGVQDTAMAGGHVSTQVGPDGTVTNEWGAGLGASETPQVVHTAHLGPLSFDYGGSAGVGVGETAFGDDSVGPHDTGGDANVGLGFGPEVGVQLGLHLDGDEAGHEIKDGLHHLTHVSGHIPHLHL